MTVRNPSHAEDLGQIDRYERITHALIRNGMDPNLVDKVILTSTLSAMIAAIDQLDKTLRETAGVDGDVDRKARERPKRHRSILKKFGS